MGIFDSLFNRKDDKPDLNSNVITRSEFISYGKNKKDGSHDHRTNCGNDRTPAQKAGDKARRK